MSLWIRRPDQSGQCCECKGGPCETCCKDYAIADLFWSGPTRFPGDGGFVNIHPSIYAIGIPSSCQPYRVTLTAAGTLFATYPAAISIDVTLGNQRKIEALIARFFPGIPNGIDTKNFNIVMAEDLAGDNSENLFAEVRIAASAVPDARGIPGIQCGISLAPGHPPP